VGGVRGGYVCVGVSVWVCAHGINVLP